MTIKREEFVKVLTQLRPGLASKDIVSQSTSFVFEEGKIITYNDEICVSKKFDAGFNGAVRANELYKLLSKGKGEDLELICTDGELIVKSGRSKAGIKLEAEILLPIDEVDSSSGKSYPLPKDFVKALIMASNCSAKDLSRPILTCICIEGAFAIATDGFRIIEVEMESELDIAIKELLIPATVARQLVGYDFYEISVSQGWAHFKAKGDLTFSCRILAGDFPNTEEFMDVEGSEIQFPQGILEMIERAGIFTKASSEGDFITIIIEDRKMTIKGQGDFGWLEESANCKYKGETIEFCVDPSFLFDILKDLKKCTVSENGLLFEGDNYRHLVSLVA